MLSSTVPHQIALLHSFINHSDIFTLLMGHHTPAARLSITIVIILVSADKVGYRTPRPSRNQTPTQLLRNYYASHFLSYLQMYTVRVPPYLLWDTSLNPTTNFAKAQNTIRNLQLIHVINQLSNGKIRNSSKNVLLLNSVHSSPWSDIASEPSMAHRFPTRIPP